MAEIERVTAAVMIIGDEILSGRTQDTNLNFIAKYLATYGIDLAEARVVGDIKEEIISALNTLRARYDYVITTGGIGPTHDDITADCVAEAFGVKLYEHPEIIAMMQARWQGELNAARRRMARIPEGGSLVKNAVQGPPGFQIGNVFVLAGVPMVMRGMMDDVVPRLRTGAVVIARTVRVEGAGEHLGHCGHLRVVGQDGQISAFRREADFDPFHRLHRDDGLRQAAIKARIPGNMRAKTRGKSARHHLKNSAYGIAGAIGLIHHLFHSLFGLRIDARKKDLGPLAKRDQFLPNRPTSQPHFADADDVAQH